MKILRKEEKEKINEIPSKIRFHTLLKQNQSKFSNVFHFNEEKELDNKREIEYISLLTNEMKKLKIRVDNKEKEIEKEIQNIEESSINAIKEKIIKKSEENLSIRNRINSLEQKTEAIQMKIKQDYFNEMNKLIDCINSIRKENAIKFENKVEILSKNNKEINQLKKKLYLYINFLKLRILDEEEKEGYLINKEKYILRKFSLSKISNSKEERILKTKFFWKNFIFFSFYLNEY